ncbi:unnamed protein product [Lupinus luteus]|uniref:BHLH domain-containing protein n=1 Tax=Lupinus luteus TaxID=3873 RepID=A0AAV1WZ74_LUPLU
MAKLKWRRREKREKGGRALQKKMKKLQRLIPNGGRLKPDQLFLRTAEHIMQLRLQLNNTCHYVYSKKKSLQILTIRTFSELNNSHAKHSRN